MNKTSIAQRTNKGKSERGKIDTEEEKTKSEKMVNSGQKKRGDSFGFSLPPRRCAFFSFSGTKQKRNAHSI